MKPKIAEALAAGMLFMSAWSAAGAQELRALTPPESRAFHLCLYAAWVQDYCRSRGFFALDGAWSFEQCMAANRAPPSPPGEGSYFGANAAARQACWAQAQGVGQ